MENNTITMTTKVGRFLFFSSDVLSHCKIVRDSVMGHILNPQNGLPRIKSSAEASAFVKQHVEGPASSVLFKFIPA